MMGHSHIPKDLVGKKVKEPGVHSNYDMKTTFSEIAITLKTITTTITTYNDLFIIWYTDYNDNIYNSRHIITARQNLIWYQIVKITINRAKLVSYSS